MKFNNKERFMFWIGILIGISSGIFTNFIVGTALDIARNGYDYLNTSVFIISGVLLTLILVYITKKLSKLIRK